METDKQTADNAQESTGQTSAAGKAASSRNTLLRSGLYIEDLQARREKPEHIHDLAREYYYHYQPATPVERELCDRIIRTVHLTRRLTRAESSLWNRMWENNPERVSPDADHGAAAERGGLHFGRIPRRLNQLDRTYDETVRTLELLQERRRSVPDRRSSETQVPEPAPTPKAEVIFSEDEPYEPQFPEPFPENGSVPPNPNEPAVPDPPPQGFGFVPSASAAAPPRPPCAILHLRSLASEQANHRANRLPHLDPPRSGVRESNQTG